MSLTLRVRILAVLVLLVMLGQFSRAQSLSVGVTGGAVLNDDIQKDSWGVSESKRASFGPVLELKLSSRISFQGAVLYRRVGYTSDVPIIPYGDQVWVRANSWELPFLVRYYFPTTNKFARAFVSGSCVLRHISDANQIDQLRSFPDWELKRHQRKATVASDPSLGLAAGGGIHVGSGRFRVSPELRYTRWRSVPFEDYSPYGYKLRSSPNQLELLFTLTFVVLGK